MSSKTVYFGGSRHLSSSPKVAQVVKAVMQSGAVVHVGCQKGADQQVVIAAQAVEPGRVCVFCVASQEPSWVLGSWVKLSAGGPETIPLNARYLRRSIAAFQGCQAAIFFKPGPGSLAVAREAVKTGLSVFAFSETQPAPVPNQRGQWCQSFFLGFQCWQWGRLSNQIPLF